MRIGQIARLSPTRLPGLQRFGEVARLTVDDAQIEEQRRLPGGVRMSVEKTQQWLDGVLGAGPADEIPVRQQCLRQLPVLASRGPRRWRQRLYEQPGSQEFIVRGRG